jgi:hypothetical protein
MDWQDSFCQTLDGFESIRFLFVISIAIGAMRINNPRVVEFRMPCPGARNHKKSRAKRFHHQSGREK